MLEGWAYDTFYLVFVTSVAAAVVLKVALYRTRPSPAILAQIIGIIAGSAGALLGTAPLGPDLDTFFGIPDIHVLVSQILLILWATGLKVMVDLWMEEREAIPGIILGRGIVATAVTCSLIALYMKDDFQVPMTVNSVHDDRTLLISVILCQGYLMLMNGQFLTSTYQYLPDVSSADALSAYGIRILILAAIIAIAWLLVSFSIVITAVIDASFHAPGLLVLDKILLFLAGTTFLVGISLPQTYRCWDWHRHKARS